MFKAWATCHKDETLAISSESRETAMQAAAEKFAAMLGKPYATFCICSQRDEGGDIRFTGYELRDGVAAPLKPWTGLPAHDDTFDTMRDQRRDDRDLHGIK